MRRASDLIRERKSFHTRSRWTHPAGGLLRFKGRSSRSAESGRSHRGIALLTAIVCLLILSALSVSLVRTVLARVRESTSHESLRQADALAESALQRGISQRQANPTYSGEIWSPELPGLPRMQAEIQWTDSPAPGTLRVLCLVPSDAAHPVRVERIVPTSSLPLKKAE